MKIRRRMEMEKDGLKAVEEQKYKIFEKKLYTLAQMPEGPALANELTEIGMKVRELCQTLETKMGNKSFFKRLRMKRDRKNLLSICKNLEEELQNRHNEIIHRHEISYESGAMYAAAVRILREILEERMNELKYMNILFDPIIL